MFSNRRIESPWISGEIPKGSFYWAPISIRIWECRGQIMASVCEQLLRIVLSGSTMFHFAPPKALLPSAAASALAVALR